MCRSDCRAALVALLLLVSGDGSAAQPWETLGKALDPGAIVSWDIDVRPDGRGLPPGRGSVAEGQPIYDSQCASCHGTFGESTDYLALTGGIGSLASTSPQRTAGSKLNYATTLWDYINRAMPFNAPKTLSANEVYAVTAYVLNLNEIVPADAVLDEHTLPQVRMPNRAGFTEDHGMRSRTGKPDVQAEACMRDCAAVPQVASTLPAGFTEQMYGDIRGHFRQLASATPLPPEAAPAAAGAPGELARQFGCLTCHGIEKALVGPAFHDVSKRYGKDAGAAAALEAKVRKGGGGTWGTTAMPPQSGPGDEQLAALIRWILAGAPP